MKLTGDLCHRGILREEFGYFIIRQSMPYPLAENNTYLIETSQGWAVIDVGVDLPSTRDVWSRAVKEIGIPFTYISQIYITHCHPDHLGAAHWLQKVSGAPVFMLAEEIERATNFIFFESDHENNYRKAIEHECKRQNFAPELVEELVRSWCYEVTPLFPKPEVLLPLQDDQNIDLQGERFEIIPVPVHSDGQFLLWSSKINHLFCADLIAADSYIHFSDWPHTMHSNPLQSLFTSIDTLLAMGKPQVFPGHGMSFNDLPLRLKALRERHMRKLDKVRRIVRGDITAGELYYELYELIDYVHLHRVALGETLGYLEYLSSIGDLHKFDGGERVIFTR